MWLRLRWELVDLEYDAEGEREIGIQTANERGRVDGQDWVLRKGRILREKAVCILFYLEGWKGRERVVNLKVEIA
jgi:hypothetical protein